MAENREGESQIYKLTKERAIQIIERAIQIMKNNGWKIGNPEDIEVYERSGDDPNIADTIRLRQRGNGEWINFANSFFTFLKLRIILHLAIRRCGVVGGAVLLDNILILIYSENQKGLQ